MFAALEALVRDTKVHNYNPGISPRTLSLDFQLKTKTQSLKYAVSTTVSQLDFHIGTEVYGVVESLICPKINDASIAGLQASVKDEKIDTLRAPVIIDVESDLDTHAIDFLAVYEMTPGNGYALGPVSVGNLPLVQFETRVHPLRLAIRPSIKDKTAALCRFPVERKAAVLSFIKESSQLYFWKQAVIKTGKGVKDLTLVGLFTGIPLESVGTLKIDTTRRCLNFYFKDNIHHLSLNRKREPLREIAVFRDLETDKAIKVTK